jgi:hypothetical protein
MGVPCFLKRRPKTKKTKASIHPGHSEQQWPEYSIHTLTHMSVSLMTSHKAEERDVQTLEDRAPARRNGGVDLEPSTRHSAMSPK